MPDIRVEDEQGVTHVFPDGSTPEMIAKAMNVKAPGQPPPPAQQQQPTGILNNLGQGLIGAGKSALRSVYNAGAVQGPPYLQGSGLPINQSPPPQSIQPSNTAQRYGGYAETGVELVAPFLGAGKAAVSATEALPNLGRAGKVIGQVEQDIGSLPVETASTMQHAQRAAQLTEAGHGAPPPPVVKFMQRMAIKFEGDQATQIPSRLTFQEARDMYSAAADFIREPPEGTTGRMLNTVRDFTKSLGSDIQATADNAGQKLFGPAMKEYADASSLADKISVLKKYAGKAGASALGLGGGYEILKKLGVIK